MRIAIVNDMLMATEGLRRIIEMSGLHKVIWTAANGEDAVRLCGVDLPDLVLMDIIMPGMNGVETTRSIMNSTPCPILIVTSSVNKNSALVFEAMGYGALDAVNTPVLIGNTSDDAVGSLLKKISLLNILTQPKIGSNSSEKPAVSSAKDFSSNKSLVAIGASSGGPQALATVLKSIPGDFPSPIVIVQHVDVQFATGLAEWLNTQAQLQVSIARSGDRPEVGKIFLAGSEDHLVLSESGRFEYSADPLDTPYRPSVDVFWQSLSQHWKGYLTAVLLTGMGRDGARSMLELRKKGAFTIAQDANTCAVYGMPKAAAEIGAAMRICAVEDIAELLIANHNARKLNNY